MFDHECGVRSCVLVQLLLLSPASVVPAYLVPGMVRSLPSQSKPSVPRCFWNCRPRRPKPAAQSLPLPHVTSSATWLDPGKNSNYKVHQKPPKFGAVQALQRDYAGTGPGSIYP